MELLEVKIMVNQVISVDLKEEGSKLLRIDVEFEQKNNDEYNDGSTDLVIKKIIITGDFFVHPEDLILKIEEELKGVRAREEELLRVINGVIDKTKELEGQKQEVKLVGLTPEMIVKAIMKAGDKVK